MHSNIELLAVLTETGTPAAHRFFCFVLFFLVTREGPHPPRTCLIFVLGKDEKLNWEVTGLKLKSRGHTQNCMLSFWFSKIKKFRPALERKR